MTSLYFIRRGLAWPCWIALACYGLGATEAPVAAQDFTLTDEQFDSWLTNGNTTVDKRVESQLAMELRSLDQSCKLSPEQKAKLELAGQGDAARFQGRVAELRSRLVGKTYDQNEMNNIWQEISPLQQEVQAGLLGEASLFTKIVRRTLDEDQSAKYEAVQAERRTAMYAAKVKLYVAMIERSAPMRAQQREALIELFLKRTRPPKRFGENEIYYVMYQASTMDRKEITKIFDNAQMKVITPAFRQGANYKSFLTQQGFVLDDEPAAKEKPLTKQVAGNQAAKEIAAEKEEVLQAAEDAKEASE